MASRTHRSTRVAGLIGGLAVVGLVIDPEGRIAARIVGTITATTLTQLINDVHTAR